MYTYIMFGISIESEVDLGIPESSIEQVELTIQLLPTIAPEKLEDEAVFDIDVRREGVILRLTDAGRFVVKEQVIQVMPYIGYDPGAISLYLKGTVMGAWLLQKGRIALHGSAIRIGNKALVITGESGAGKSSLARGFIEQGFTLISDDVALLRKEGTYVIEPSYAAQKLWVDTAEHYEIDYHDSLRITYRDDKYNISVEPFFCSEPMELGAVCHLTLEDGPLEIHRLRQSEALECLLKNIYLEDLLEYFDLGRPIFRTMAEVSMQVPVYQIQRPNGVMTVQLQMDHIFRQILTNM
jgi:hypothetical protein